ncbi:hypothetical protein [Anaeromyxobacter oryzae]|uniref:hypothetical protein n=1 Tax=Anaeromyxobacter oryzae TaxID=2918170 RepID=UPI0020BD6913|nr:hypothetical protein [Anaeromyxobacter oryzae]
MLTCVHHISWIRPVDGGLHQCILCHQVVGRKDVYPKLEDLPPEVARRWEEHERSAAPKDATAAPAKGAATSPGPSSKDPAGTAKSAPAASAGAPVSGVTT